LRRLAAVALAALLLAAAGCGESPEDKARNAGEAIGGDVYDAQNATTVGDARDALTEVKDQIRELGDDLPGSVRTQLSAIVGQLEGSLSSARDPAAVRQAFLDARSQLDALASDTDSVVTEFRRGVRTGYEDAAG
jgi:hypothetical protein